MKKNGCFDRVIKMTTLVQDGYKEIQCGEKLTIYGAQAIFTLVPNFVERPFRMSTDCRYDRKMIDEGCECCKHQQKNYLVNISSRKYYHCSTPEEVWKIIGNRGIGDTYLVSSPNGTDCSEFIPF